MLCPNCAKPVPARAAFCPRCGSPLSPDGEPAGEQRAAPAEVVHEELIESVPRFRFLMMPSLGMFVIPIIILVLFMLGFGFCVIPIRL